MSASSVVFAAVIAAELLLIASIVASIVRPAWRIWPPGARDWRFWWSWGLLKAALVGAIVLAWLDRGTFVFDHWGWKVAGVALFVVAEGLNEWAVRSVRRPASWGLEAELSTAGPYRWTRNPQYLLQSAMVVAVVLVSNSALTAIAGGVGIAALLLAPFAEEKWLEETYGEAYREYRRRTPRFLGRRREGRGGS
ncbi:MAG: isoprenylcysteine carboxylmethyltransferase family protein [Gemmatimonadota bacterium]|nr:isoprenylcysteine carboxylmethyltransferase family protein [Gemmatimonadota bacterium]